MPTFRQLHFLPLLYFISNQLGVKYQADASSLTHVLLLLYSVLRSFLTGNSLPEILSQHATDNTQNSGSSFVCIVFNRIFQCVGSLGLSMTSGLNSSMVCIRCVCIIVVEGIRARRAFQKVLEEAKCRLWIIAINAWTDSDN